MQAGTLCVVQANQGAETIDAPVSHGSISTEYAPFVDRRSEGVGCASGEKMRRKLASAFRCLTVNDMATGGWIRLTEKRARMKESRSQQW